MNNEMRFDKATEYLSPNIRKGLANLPLEYKKIISEVRLRVNRPVVLTYKGSAKLLSEDGIVPYNAKNKNNLIIATVNDIEESFKRICGYSIHTHQGELVSGYVTTEGGHRCGVCGTCVEDDGKIIGVRDISSLNLRISREIKGAADVIISVTGLERPTGFIVAGAPASGKTTVLRDIARQLGQRHRVAVVDERGEIASCFNGMPQNDIGLMTDVLNGYAKAEGIMQALRTLSPEYIICDEIGTAKEINAVAEGLNGGVNMITSIHAENMEQLMSRPQANMLLETGAFDRIFFMGKAEKLGMLEEVVDISQSRTKTGGKISADFEGSLASVGQGIHTDYPEPKTSPISATFNERRSENND